MALYIVSERASDRDAVPTLVYRIRHQVQIDLPHHSADRHGWVKPLITQAHVHSACEAMRAISSCEALLLTRDADNDFLHDQDCPRFTAPELGEWTRALNLPFPVAVVLFYKEFETLFLAGASGMAGLQVKDKRGQTIHTIHPDASSHPDPEYPRDAKGWVRTNLIPNYKESLLQNSVTSLLDLDQMAGTGLSSYRRLVSALRFLSTHLGLAGAVYPPSPQIGETGG